MGEVVNDRIARFTEMIGREGEVLEEMAQRVADGETLVEVCKAWDVPYGRFHAWLVADARRLGMYEGAQRIRADAFAAETVRIADGAPVRIEEYVTKAGVVVPVVVEANHQRDRLSVETRLKLAARWDRARYGGDGEAPVRAPASVDNVTLLEAARRIAFVLARGAQMVERPPREPRLLEHVPEHVPAEVPAEDREGEI